MLARSVKWTVQKEGEIFGDQAQFPILLAGGAAKATIVVVDVLPQTQPVHEGKRQILDFSFTPSPATAA